LQQLFLLHQHYILGDLLAFVIELLITFHEIRINYTDDGKNPVHFGSDPVVGGGAGGHPNADQSGNLDSNPGPPLVEATKVQGVRCT